MHESEGNIPIDFGYVMFCDENHILPAKSQMKKVPGFHKMKLLVFGKERHKAFRSSWA